MFCLTFLLSKARDFQFRKWTLFLFNEGTPKNYYATSIFLGNRIHCKAYKGLYIDCKKLIHAMFYTVDYMLVLVAFITFISKIGKNNDNLNKFYYVLFFWLDISLSHSVCAVVNWRRINSVCVVGRWRRIISGDNTCRIQKVMFDFDVITESRNGTPTKRTPVLFFCLHET